MEEKATELLKHFDSIFDTNTLNNIDFNNLPMLKKLFEYFEEDLYTPSPKYKELRKKHIEVADLLEKTFTEAQQTLFEKVLGTWKRNDLRRTRTIYFGVIIGKTFDKETQLIKETNK